MEFDDLGSRCNHCNRQDYLPLQCLFCKKDFCKEHIKHDIHNCTNFTVKQNIIKEVKYKKNRVTCCNKTCKESVILIQCSACSQRVCVPHRYNNMHPCQKIRIIKKKYEKKDENNSHCLECRII
jgi:predicted nucleic acid binding AN1-type Zn finger protein